MKEGYEKKILSVPEGEYGKKYREHLLEQYKIYIASLNHTSNLRHKVNSYFLTLHTLFLAAIGASLYKEATFIQGDGQLAIPFIGIIISLIWWAITFTYKQRSIVKLKIVHKIEKLLPLSLYQNEWDILSKKPGSTSYHFFRTSLLIPWVFSLLYVFIILFSL
jgi:hypothetical protein